MTLTRITRLSLLILLTLSPARAATLEVGPDRTFTRIEDAIAKAQPGDTILVHPQKDRAPYEKTAVFVRQKNLTIRAAASGPDARVKISGRGFDYSGIGSTPRAIFQFNAGADGCTLQGFELSGAHNDSHNGAGVRIVQASHVTIRNCDIHHNDMGVMSSGDGTLRTALDQRIELCLIHHNGDPADPGYNHNLYLGGTSVTLSGCEVHHSLTGHNVKSRAHYTRVEYCYIHDSANRECDLVDSDDTAYPDSHAVLLGNIIAKDPRCSGNGAVIHFGQDGKRPHNGTLYLVFNTIITPLIAPVIELSTSGAQARLTGNLISDGGTRQGGQTIATARAGGRLESMQGAHNWFSGSFRNTPTPGLPVTTNRFERAAMPLFVNPPRDDYRLSAQSNASTHPEGEAITTTPLTVRDLIVPGVPGVESNRESPLAWQYAHPAHKIRRPPESHLSLGALAR